MNHIFKPRNLETRIVNNLASHAIISLLIGLKSLGSYYKIDQLQQIFRTHCVKRKLSTGAFEFSKIEDARGGLLKQHSKIIQGIDKEISQLINKTLKSSKLKVQVAIRGDEVRVTGNKRDNLQEAIQLIKDLNIKQPLQYINFRD